MIRISLLMTMIAIRINSYIHWCLILQFRNHGSPDATALEFGGSTKINRTASLIEKLEYKMFYKG